VTVDNGARTSQRKLFASQAHSLPTTSLHEWVGTDRGTLLELRLGSGDLDYSKPLFLSVLNDVSLSYTILGEMVPPESGGKMMGCSFSVSNTTFSAALSLAATSAISELCTKHKKSADAFMQQLLNSRSPLSGWEVVGAVSFEVYKALLSYAANLTMPEGYQTLTLTASSPYPYQGPKVLTLWRPRSELALAVKRIPFALATKLQRNSSNTSFSSTCRNPGWVVQGHSSSLDERTQFWITTVFNQYLCRSTEPEQWDWDSARAIGGITDRFWVSYSPVQTVRGWKWEVSNAVALDRPEVHWIWVTQSADASTSQPQLFVVLHSVPVVPTRFRSQ
jgi:hypothetical protein